MKKEENSTMEVGGKFFGGDLPLQTQVSAAPPTNLKRGGEEKTSFEHKG